MTVRQGHMRPKTGYHLFSKPFIWLLFITLLFLLYSGLVIDERWIDVDEGAHLADAQLLLQGQVPYVDYLSRQPFYVVHLGLFVKLLGIHYGSGRWLGLFSALSAGFLIFLIARQLFPKRTSMIAMLLFLAFPLVLLYAPMTKMNFVVTVWNCLAIYLFLRFYKTGTFGSMILVGVVTGFAFYVRASSLAVPATLVVMIFLLNGSQVKTSLRQTGGGVTGFFLVATAVFLFYAQFIDFDQFVRSPLNPFDMVFQSVSKIQSLWNARSGIANQSGDLQILSLFHVKHWLAMTLVLFGGMAIYCAGLVIRARPLKDTPVLEWIFPLWTLFTALVYSFQFFHHGFFPEYGAEFYPSLMICLAVVLFKPLPWKKLTWSFILVLAIFSMVHMSRHIRWSYQAIWPPSLITTVNDELVKRSDVGDTVFSGGMIWTANPHLNPYLKITHPTGLLSEPATLDYEILSRQLVENPPAFVVLDGFTIRCFSPIVGLLRELLRQRYDRIEEYSGGPQLVRVYKLRAQ
ncbi:hypothetical protein GF406_05035 [candidate division KSB1 bacterium]|nr:hypothetical protein [candidate division KSB1 bacterium]